MNSIQKYKQICEDTLDSSKTVNKYWKNMSTLATQFRDRVKNKDISIEEINATFSLMSRTLSKINKMGAGK